MDSRTIAQTSAAAATEANRARDASADAPAASSSKPEEMSELDNIRFEALQSAFYHSMRCGQLEMVHRVLLFFTVIGGTTALAGVVASLPWLAGIAAALPTLAGTLDLVGDFAGRAAVHKGLQAKFVDIIARLDAPRADNPVAALRVDLQRAYAEEPPVKRVVHALAMNAAIRSLGRDPASLLVVSKTRYCLGWLLAFDGYDPETRRELAGRHVATRSK